MVQAGQPVFVVARETGFDAVFDVPAQLRSGADGAAVRLALTDDPKITATGTVRQESIRKPIRSPEL